MTGGKRSTPHSRGEQQPTHTVSLVVDGLPAGLVAACLSAEHGIGIRDGTFCAQPLMDRIAPDGGVRLSLGIDNSSDDIERAVSAIRAIAVEGPSYEYTLIDGRWSPASDPRHLPGMFGGDRLDRLQIAGPPCRSAGA